MKPTYKVLLVMVVLTSANILNPLCNTKHHIRIQQRMYRAYLVELVLNIRGYFESCVLYNMLQQSEDILCGILK
jgi:hypothetical protein